MTRGIAFGPLILFGNELSNLSNAPFINDVQ